MVRAPLIWFAEEGSIAVNGVLLSTRVTNIEMRGGARDAELIRTYGRGGITAERPQENFETTISAVVSGLEFAQHVFGAGSTTAGGVLISGDGTRSKINVVYTWHDPTDANGPTLRLRYASGFGTSVEITGAVDGQLEQTVTFKSIPSNTFWEFSSGPASTLVIPQL